MTKLLRAGLWVSALGLSSTVFGACGHSVNTDYCGPELIRLVYVDAGGLVYVQPTTTLAPVPAGFVCTPVSGESFVILDNQAPWEQGS
jgi:hypothetical protein